MKIGFKKLGKMGRSAEEVQKDFAKINGYQNEILWDLYTLNQANILKDKIGSLIPDPSNSSIRMREVLFNSVWAQRKYTNRNLLSSIFYVLVVDTESLTKALSSTTFSCHPVFRTRKCTDNSNSSKCCMIYIDETGRVYKNWKAYLMNNILPRGTIIAPAFGVYTSDHENFDLYCGPTPASSTTAKALQTVDSVCAYTGLTSAGIAIATICSVPVAAPIVAIGSAIGLVTVGYSTLRSGSNLWDRNQHEQSLSLTDRQARNSWLGLTSGAVGFGASAATGAMTRAAAAGSNVPKITKAVVNGMNISSCVVSGGGVVNIVLDMILMHQDDEKIRKMDVLQLAASLVMFTHSVSNFRLAKNIVQEAQNGRIQTYREGLSNRQRKMFDKMTRETMRIRGTDRGRIDVIRSVREMPSKQYLNDLHKINRQLNAKKVRPAFGGAEKPVVLNSEIAVDTAVLRNSVQHNVGPDILGQVKQSIPDAHVNSKAAAITGTSSKAGVETLKLQQGVKVSNKGNSSENRGVPTTETTFGVSDLMNSNLILYSGTIIKFVELGSWLFKNIKDIKTFEKEVKNLAKEVSDKCFYFLINAAKEFIESTLINIEQKYEFEIPREHLIGKLFDIIKSYDKKIRENISEKVFEMMRTLREYFSSSEYRNNSTLQKLKTSEITLSSGAKMSMGDLGNQFFEHIVDVDNFKDIITNMTETFDDDTFRLLLNVAESFIETRLSDIHKLLQIHISTEDILHKILVHCLEGRTDLSCEALNKDTSKMLDVLESYYRSINPRSDPFMQKKCEICSGFYAVCDL